MVTLFFANVIGWLTAHKRLVAYAVGAFLLLVLVIMAFRGCKSSKAIKIDEPAIQKINSENEAERKKQLEEIIYENEQIIKTVEERNKISEVNRIEKENAINEKIKEADKKISEAKQQGRNINAAELECILLPETCK